jgi:hypothetical protein
VTRPPVVSRRKLPRFIISLRLPATSFIVAPGKQIAATGAAGQLYPMPSTVRIRSSAAR